MTTQDSQSELDELIRSALHQIHTRALRDAPVYLQHVSSARHSLKASIEAYVTTRVKEAERLARISENKIWQELLVARMELDRYSPNSIHVIDFEKRINHLTTTTNGKEE